MTLRLYNTLSRSKEDFVPLDPKNVRMYVCGPTVYDFAHIGNARPVIVFDMLFRLLRHIYGEDHVTYVRNVTDIDDKINARASERGISIRDLTDETYQNFHNDIAALGCLAPTYEPRATDHIEEMKEIIELLLSSEHAYIEQEHVLFSVPSMVEYGLLSNRPLDELIAGARVDVAPFKRNPTDFVLWKPSDDRKANYPLPGWPSPGNIESNGRPGWHIECSAMAWRYLREQFDIHGGGIDLIFPHHENEIAQSRCAFHTPQMAKYWMHNGFLNVEAEKMSKSLGNFVTIRELLRNYPGGAIRFAMLQTHYTQPINWTTTKLNDAWEEMREWATGIYGSPAAQNMYLRKAEGRPPIPHSSILNALETDLNSPEVVTALRALFKKRDDDNAYSALIESCEFLGLFAPDTIGAYDRGISSKGLWTQQRIRLHEFDRHLKVALINKNTSTSTEIQQKLGEEGIVADVSYDGFVRYESSNVDEVETSHFVQQAIAARNALRDAKNFKEADRIRDELAAKGIVLKDGPDGTTWEVKR